jgi:hypothetical protein
VLANGIFMIAELVGEAGERIRQINLKYDPRLARYKAPHVTITGSSGAGPLPASVTVAEMSEKLGPIAAATAPLSLRFGSPMRFMSTEIIVLPLDPHGPLRVFHDKVAGSGLPFQQARFTFSPHCTLSLYPTLSREVERELLSLRVTEPVKIDCVTMYQTLDPQPSKKLLELKLTGIS